MRWITLGTDWKDSSQYVTGHHTGTHLPTYLQIQGYRFKRTWRENPHEHRENTWTVRSGTVRPTTAPLLKRMHFGKYVTCTDHVQIMDRLDGRQDMVSTLKRTHC